jgi:hypothetical protein
MDKIISAYDIAKSNTIKGDFIDRLHSKYTVIFLFSTCILVGLRQYDKKAIACWLPNQFSDEQTAYTHQLCWVNNTYYYPSEKDADLFPETLKHVIPYYQFILFLLLAQSVLFYFPTLIWRSTVNDSAGYINKLLDQVEKSKIASVINDASKQNEASKNNDLNQKLHSKSLLKTISEKEEALIINDDSMNSQDSSSQDFKNPSFLSSDYTEKFKHDFKTLLFVERTNSKSGKKYSAYEDDQEKASVLKKQESANTKKRFHFNRSQFSQMSKKKIISFMKPKIGVKNLAKSYLLLKFLNLLNVFLQIVMLHFIFGAEFYKYGLDFLSKLMTQQDPYELSTQFPILTFCDFYVHQNMRQIHWNTVQCILSINILIEKIYVIIWFWLVLLLVVTFFNLFSWIFEIILPGRIEFLFKYINIRIKMLNNVNNLNGNSIDLNARKTRQVANDQIISYVTKENLKKFQNKYLSNDGYIMLHIIKSVAGDIVFMELLYEIWMDFVNSNAHYENSEHKGRFDENDENSRYEETRKKL